MKDNDEEGVIGSNAAECLQSYIALIESLLAATHNVIDKNEKLNQSTYELQSARAELMESTLAKIEQVNVRLSSVEASQTDLRSGFFQKLHCLQGTGDSVKEDINVDFAASATAWSNARTARGDIDNVTELLSAMDSWYRTFAAQVEELRKDQADKNAS